MGVEHTFRVVLGQIAAQYRLSSEARRLPRGQKAFHLTEGACRGHQKPFLTSLSAGAYKLPHHFVHVQNNIAGGPGVTRGPSEDAMLLSKRLMGSVPMGVARVWAVAALVALM